MDGARDSGGVPVVERPQGADPRRHWPRVVVEIDASPESLLAARIAQWIAGVEGQVHLLAVTDSTAPVWRDRAPISMRTTLGSATWHLATAARQIDPATAEVRIGRPVDALLGRAREVGADIVAFGPHRQPSRLGVLSGRVEETIDSEVPCPVLLARETDGQAADLRRISVAVDGHASSFRAVEMAQRLAAAREARLQTLVPIGDPNFPVDLEAIGERATAVEFDFRAPIRALVEESRSSDLIVVGRENGRLGVAPWLARTVMGESHERVARRATCSVLIVP